MSIATAEVSTDRNTSTGVPPRSNDLVKVLHVINGEDYGGAERVQDLLALRLPEFGYEISFVCIKPDRFERVRQCQATDLVKFPMGSRLDISPVRRVARMARQGGYAIIHTHSPRTLLIGRPAAALAGVPVVHHVQCPAIADGSRRWLNQFNAVLERGLLSGVREILPVSHSLGQY